MSDIIMYTTVLVAGKPILLAVNPSLTLLMLYVYAKACIPVIAFPSISEWISYRYEKE